MAQKHFTVLENNPEVMNALAKRLGLSEELSFYDVYSLDEPELLAHIPRPAYALLAIIPLTEAWRRDREAEDAGMADYEGGEGHQDQQQQQQQQQQTRPVIWFKQTIRDACGSIGLLHCCINGGAADFVLPGSDLDRLAREARPLGREDRARMLHDDAAFEGAHGSVAGMGDSAVPSLEEGHRLGQHFVAFIRAEEAEGEGGGGHRLWELEGSRKGPLDRGPLTADEDVLSPRAVALGIGRIIKLVADAGGEDLRFSCIALARREGTTA